MGITEDATTIDLLNLPSKERRNGSSTSQRKRMSTVKRITEKKRLPKEEKPQPKVKEAKEAVTAKRKSELNLMITLSQTERTIKKERMIELDCRCES